MSVRKFTRDNLCSIEFDPFGFSVKDLLTRTTILRSTSSGDLYPFAGFNKTTNNITLSNTMSSMDLWHRHLGHPSSSSLLHLLSKFGVSCVNNSSALSSCEACHKGKHVCLPFPNSSTITYFPFQIVHCDLWTSPIESITGFKYYLSLIDDYSRYTWTFPLRFKSDTSTIREFHQYVLTQSCSSFILSQHGIVFCLSYPHTSSQNGKAERGIHTITNILHTLLFQGHLPAIYSVEAMHTATYLFNRRPSRPL
jgi:transposase InsO family protein